MHNVGRKPLSAMYSSISIAAFGALLAVSAASDAAARRIPNHLTVPLAAGGIAAQVVAFGWASAASAVGAGLAVGALLWIPWRRAWLGGGDFKLAVAAGIWIGWRGLAGFLLASALCAGAAAAVCYAASSARVRADVRTNVRDAALGRAIAVPLHGGAGRVSVPAGAAFAAGALAVVLGGGL